MTNIRPGTGILRVVIHTEDGRIMDIAPTSVSLIHGTDSPPGYVSHVANEELYQGSPKTTIEIEFPNSRSVVSESAEIYRKEIQDQKEQVLDKGNEEWGCLHCGNPNPKENRRCDPCGAPRHFLY